MDRVTKALGEGDQDAMNMSSGIDGLVFEGWSDAEIAAAAVEMAQDHRRALSKAVPTGWRPIATAPKDGTRVMLWRGFPSLGEWTEMVVAEWYDDAWTWPDHRDTPSTHGEWDADTMLRGYADGENFTHWMPLPQPPQP